MKHLWLLFWGLVFGAIALMLGVREASAQARGTNEGTWYTVAIEGDVVSSPAPMTYRFGADVCAAAGGCWSTPATTSASVSVDYQVLGDIAPGYGKVLQVQQAAAAQTITEVIPGDTTYTWQIPALPPPPPPPPPPSSIATPVGQVLPFSLTSVSVSQLPPLTYDATTGLISWQAFLAAVLPYIQYSIVIGGVPCVGLLAANQCVVQAH